MLKKVILFILLFSPLSLLNAEPIQSLKHLTDKIEAYVKSELADDNTGKIKVIAHKIDHRLHLKACPDKKLEIFNPYKTTMLHTTTIGVSCQKKDSHWTLYVPIKISLKKAIWVAKHSLTKGQIIKKTDLNKMMVETNYLKQGYFSKSKFIIGKIAKNNIGEGSPLTPLNIQEALLIHKGEQVSIQAVNEMLVISMNGVALSDGAIGEVIKVQNLSSKKIIEAEVSANKVVRVMI